MTELLARKTWNSSNRYIQHPDPEPELYKYLLAAIIRYFVVTQKFLISQTFSVSDVKQTFSI